MKSIQPKLLAQILDEILNEIKEVKLPLSLRAAQLENSPLAVIYFDLIARTMSSLMLLKFAFKNIGDEEELRALEHGIGINLRSCLQDRIIMNEIMHDLDKNNGWEDSAKKREVYIKHTSDQLGHILKTLDDLKRRGPLLNGSMDFDELKKILVRRFPEYFSDPINYVMHIKYGASVLYSSYEAKNNIRVKEDSGEIFNVWYRYSKYEHYGPITHELLNRPLEENWNTIISSLAHIVNGMAYALDIVIQTKGHQHFLIKKVDELMELCVR